MGSAFEKKLTDHRKKVDHAWREHRAVEEAMRNDRNLNASAKGRAVEESKARLRGILATLEHEEDEAIREEIARLERQIFGARTSADPMAMIAARDADDRAAQLESADDAGGMLHRALRSGDSVLALAVARRAVEAGWAEVTDQFKAERPDQGQAFDDLRALIRFRDDWRRPTVYLGP